MKTKQIIQPPRWAEKFLEFYCRPEVYEDLQGDLYEYFHRRVEEKGLRYASAIYILDVLKFIRPYTIKKPSWSRRIRFSTMMYKNYLKTSFRSLTNSTVFSLINIVGLAVAMSVGLVLITFLVELRSYDDFQADTDRVYRVKNVYVDGEAEDDQLFASTSVLAFSRMQEEVAGLESVVVLRRGLNKDFELDNKKIPLEGFYASDQFFNLFSFPLLQGNPETALKELYSVVLTETAAKKLFGNEEPIGKTLSSDTTEYMVTGVMQDPPGTSHLDFEVLCSFSTIDHLSKDDDYWMSWENMWMNHIYLKLEEGVEQEDIVAVFEQIANEENQALAHKGVSIQMGLQPFQSIIPGDDMSNQPGKSIDMAIIWVLMGLALVILLSACFNYTNLSIARSLKRSKEVGVRKVIGASSGQVFTQFVFESIVLALIALVMAYGLFLFIRPHFMGLDREIGELVRMEPTTITYVYFVLFAILVGFLAGLLPGLFFSRLNPLKVLKSVVSKPAFKGLTLGRALILIQFTFSLMFVIITTLAFNQYQFSVNYDLGYSTENILNIRLQGNDPEVLMNEMSQLSEVQDVSTSLMITSVGSYYGNRVKYKDPDDSIRIWYNAIDHRYLDLHGHSVMYGEKFRDVGKDPNPTPVIVNELLIDEAGLPGGEQSIGEVLTSYGDTLVIVGVISQFHYGTMESEMKPFLFKYDPSEVYHINVKLLSTDLISSMQRLEAVWKKVDDIHPFEARFYDDDIEQAYSTYAIMIKIVGFIASTAILIAFMGLLGMLVFTTETRMKEISVRKVMGASVQNLAMVVGKTYLILLAIATFIAIPATYLLFSEVILSDVVYKASITILELGAGVIAIVILALLAIAGQTLKAARTNPAKTLRNE